MRPFCVVAVRRLDVAAREVVLVALAVPDGGIPRLVRIPGVHVEEEPVAIDELLNALLGEGHGLRSGMLELRDPGLGHEPRGVAVSRVGRQLADLLQLQVVEEIESAVPVVPLDPEEWRIDHPGCGDPGELKELRHVRGVGWKRTPADLVGERVAAGEEVGSRWHRRERSDVVTSKVH